MAGRALALPLWQPRHHQKFHPSKKGQPGEQMGFFRAISPNYRLPPPPRLGPFSARAAAELPFHSLGRPETSRQASPPSLRPSLVHAASPHTAPCPPMPSKEARLGRQEEILCSHFQMVLVAKGHRAPWPAI